MTEKRKISVNMDEMTFGEMELFEDATGLVMSDAVRQEVVRDKNGRPVPDPDDKKGRPLKVTKMSALAMMGMVWLVLRREDPQVTLEQVRNMKMSDIDFGVEESDDDEDQVSSDPLSTNDEELSEKSEE